MNWNKVFGSVAGIRWMLLLVAGCFTLEGANWPQFRGPGALGVGDHPRLPETWSSTNNVEWKSQIPGRGWSSPIVWGKRVFITTAVSEGEMEAPKKGLYFGGERKEISKATHHWWLICLDLESGRELWRREARAAAPLQPLHIKNSYASETPVTDGQRVYAYFGNVGLFAFDLEGNPLWSQSWPAVKTRYGWGSAASPVVDGERIFLVNDNEDGSYLLSLDAKTGKTVWRVERNEKSNWATPFIWRNEKRVELVTAGSRKVRSYDLDGRQLWELSGMSSIVIPTPFAQLGLLYVGSGYVGDKVRPFYAIRPGAAGDISLPSH